jgi:hypothetical protein
MTTHFSLEDSCDEASLPRPFMDEGLLNLDVLRMAPDMASGGVLVP